MFCVLLPWQHAHPALIPGNGPWMLPVGSGWSPPGLHPETSTALLSDRASPGGGLASLSGKHLYVAVRNIKCTSVILHHNFFVSSAQAKEDFQS